MPKYVIWDKVSDIKTPIANSAGKQVWTAEEYIRDCAPWAADPATKVIISEGPITAIYFMDFDKVKRAYQDAGIGDLSGKSDEETLAAFEAFDDNSEMLVTVDNKTLDRLLSVITQQTKNEISTDKLLWALTICLMVEVALTLYSLITQRFTLLAVANLVTPCTYHILWRKYK